MICQVFGLSDEQELHGCWQRRHLESGMELVSEQSAQLFCLCGFQFESSHHSASTLLFFRMG